jgi:tRNA A-37 threonylcarbamoyl transferase component Bud32
VLSPGSRLATYEVRERLAVGGMGEVYLCRHRLLDRIDAVKVLRPHLVADDAFRRRFLREALAAARLRHPHIVTVYTADEVDDQLYLAMEYIPGADLAALIERDGGLEPTRIARLLAQIADALDAAHRLKMTHRDVKPSNVLVERPDEDDEHAYLVDFGLSKSQQAMDQDITQAGQVLGSVAYIAPEQLEGTETDGRCDQYSLACMAFECLTGTLPFPRENQIAVLTAHLTAPPPAPTALRPELPAGLDAVIARGMAKKPDDRYATCTAFVAALRAALAPPAAPTPPAPPAHAAQLVPPSAAPASAAPASAAQASAAQASAVKASAPPVTARARVAPPRPAPAARSTAAPSGGAVRLCLAVVGGPASGQVTPLADGDHLIDVAGTDSTDADAPVLLRVDGWSVHVLDQQRGAVRINGEPVTAPWSLHPGELIEVGSSLFEVRPANQLAAGSGLPDAVTLARLAHDQPQQARRGSQHPHTMVARVGWHAGRPPVPVSVPFGGTAAVALRGEPGPIGALLRWILVQTMVLHDARDLCLAVAAAPHGNDRWTWIANAPHARPGNPPLSGPHTANNDEGAAYLVRRLRELVEVRQVAASSGPALVAHPRVLAVIDDRFDVPDAEFVSAAGPRLGVHVIRLIRPTDRPPASCAVCLDVDPAGQELVLHIAGQPRGPAGTVDGVPLGYARDLAETLADA